MVPGQEIAVDIGRGKTLVIRCQAIGEPHEDGEREVFFELNGQPRIARVPDRSLAAAAPKNERAEAGNAAHIPKPMPGVIATVAVQEGQKLKRGDLLVTIEAMKMETAIQAEREGTVKRVLARPGLQVDAHDLLVEVG